MYNDYFASNLILEINVSKVKTNIRCIVYTVCPYERRDIYYFFYMTLIINHDA